MRALEFTMLTAARTGEVIGARWFEIDLASAVWTVPTGRMKGDWTHRVPLSSAALAVLDSMAPLRPEGGDGFVFPGLRRGMPLSNMGVLKLLQRVGGADLTLHGFRSTLRDWCEEATSTPHAAAEAVYRRGDLFEKRRELMQEWAKFCSADAPYRTASHAGHRERRAGETGV